MWSEKEILDLPNGSIASSPSNNNNDPFRTVLNFLGF